MGRINEKMNDYYDEEAYGGSKTFERLTTDESKLDINKFIWDDDYIF